MSIELAPAQYSEVDKRRAIAAVFAASVPPLPDGWTRTTMAGPKGIQYSCETGKDPNPSTQVSVVAASEGVVIGAGWQSRIETKHLQTVVTVAILAEADVLAFAAWLERHCTPIVACPF